VNYHLFTNKERIKTYRVSFLVFVIFTVLFLGNKIIYDTNDSIQNITDETKSNIVSSLNRFDLGFTKNSGIKNENVYFFIENQFLLLGFKESSLIYMFPETQEDGSIITTPVTMSLIGSNMVIPMGVGETISKNSYFIGSDPNSWSSKENLVTKIIYKDIYDDIDLVYELQDGNLKYEFHVNPGADYNQIKVHWDGPITLSNDKEGIEIVVRTKRGINMVDTSPVNFQSLDRKKPIDGEMKLIDEATYKFDISDYDPTKILIIDPYMILEFSTYFNANSNDAGMDIEIGPEGNIYVGGRLQSSDFPTTPDSYDPTWGGSYDIFVMKLTPDGQTILFSTYIGGSSSDYGGELAIDKFGDVYVTGYTYSSNFPMVNPINDTYSGGTYQDLVVFKLSSDGKNLLYSTYVLGSRSDTGTSIVVDNAGAAYVVGYTFSIDFPTTYGAFNTSSDGSTSVPDIVAFKIKPGGGELLFSTYISGNEGDYVSDIILDRFNNMLIAGATYSTNFPMVNPINHEPKNTTEAEGYLLKLSASGGELLSSSLIGGNKSDSISKLALDDSNILYLSGTTSSKDFPLVDAFNASWIPVGTDLFLMKISEDLDEILYSSIIGGNKSDVIGGMGIDDEGKFYISGSTYSEDFPVVNPFQATGDKNEGFYDIYVFILDPLRNELTFSTYITGSDHHDSCYGAFLDKDRNFYLTGYSESSDFPMANPHNNTQQFTSELIVVKLAFYTEPTAPQMLTGYITIDNKAFLNWIKPSYEGKPAFNRYNIYRKVESESEYTLIGSSFIEYYIDMTFELGTNYNYVVTAVNALGESKNSNTIDLALSPTVPDPPINVLLNTDNDSIFISWDAPVNEGIEEISRYQIYRGTASGEYEMIAVTTQTSYYDSNIEAETRYFYVVTAVSSIGESIFSGEKSVVSAEKTAAASPFIDIPLVLLFLVITSVVYRKKSSQSK